MGDVLIAVGVSILVLGLALGLIAAALLYRRSQARKKSQVEAHQMATVGQDRRFHHLHDQPEIVIIHKEDEIPAMDDKHNKEREM